MAVRGALLAGLSGLAPKRARALLGRGSHQILTVNITQSPYNAVGDGVTDNLAAFNAFVAWAVQQTVPIELIIPPGTYYFSQEPLLATIGASSPPFAIIKNLTVYGYGATLLDGYLGGFGVEQAGWPIETASAGSTTLTFVTAGNAASFATDPNGNPTQWCMIAGIEMQESSYPPNDHYFEYAQVASVNTSAGTVTLKTPLRNSYQSTLPSYDFYSSWTDGAATIYALDPRWAGSVTWKGVHFRRSGQSYAPCYSATFVDCAFDGSITPSHNSYFEADNCTLAGAGQQVEFDKLVSNAVFNNCTAPTVVFQSSSNDSVTINGGTYGYISGTVKNTTLNGVTVSNEFIIGPYGYGESSMLTMNNCTIASIDYEHNTTPLSSFSFSNGVFSWANSNGPVPWAIPGARAFLFDDGNAERVYAGFTITDVTQDASNTYVHTSSGWTSLPSWTGPLPAPAYVGTLGGNAVVSASNNVGCPVAVELSAPNAQGRPVGSYLLRTYSGNITGYQAQAKVWGFIDSVKVTVSQPYTGAQSSCLLELQQYGIPCWNDSYVTSQCDIFINLQAAGTRVITQSGVTGQQSGDVIPSIAGLHMVEGIQPYLATNIGGDTPAEQPIVTIEVITDQTQ